MMKPRILDMGRSKRPLRTDTKAVAALELALTAPFLTLIFAFMTDIGLYLFTSLQISNAVAAGAEYALINGQSVSPNSAGCGTATPPCLTVTSLRSNLATIVQNATTVNLAGTTVYYNTSSSTEGDTDAVFNSCYCPNPTLSADNQVSTTCGTACADSTQPGSYVAIRATASFTPWFTSDLWMNSGTVSRTAWVRVQ
jgi:hypothetical protein